MNEQNKNKIKIHVKQCSLKVAFQSNIFKYIQKKKQEASIFSSLNKKYSSSQKNHHANSSNLIQKKKQPLPLQNHLEDIKQLKIQSTKKNLLTQRKFNRPTQNRKVVNKGYKSSLSDWRNLYQDRDQISQRNVVFCQQKQKMIATDRLFYPSRRQNCSKLEKSEQKYSDKLQLSNKKPQKGKNLQLFESEGKIMSSTISYFKNLIREKQIFKNQNFFQLYDRSKSPILSDLRNPHLQIIHDSSKKNNKHRSKSGVGLMNEGILYDTPKVDKSFVPYYQQQFSKDLLLQNSTQKHDYQNSILSAKQSNKLNEPGQISPANYLRVRTKSNKNNRKSINLQIFSSEIIPQKSIDKAMEKSIENSMMYSQFQNPQNPIKQERNKDAKIMSNLSQIFSGTLDSKNIEESPKSKHQLELKLFKAKKNKIQNGIFSTRRPLHDLKSLGKQINDQKKFANFQYSSSKRRFRNTELNWIK